MIKLDKVIQQHGCVPCRWIIACGHILFLVCNILHLSWRMFHRAQRLENKGRMAQNILVQSRNSPCYWINFTVRIIDHNDTH